MRNPIAIHRQLGLHVDEPAACLDDYCTSTYVPRRGPPDSNWMFWRCFGTRTRQNKAERDLDTPHLAAVGWTQMRGALVDGRPRAPGSAIQPCIQQMTQSTMHIKRINSNQQIIYQCLRKCSRWQIRESSRAASLRRMPLTYSPSCNGNTMSPIAQRSLAEQLSTPPPGPTGATLDDSDPELHQPVMNRHFWHNIPINERTKADWDKSMGVVFEGSRAQGFVRHGMFHCIVIPHGSHEPVFYGSQRCTLILLRCLTKRGMSSQSSYSIRWSCPCSTLARISFLIQDSSFG